jgi:hypothetical protein
MPRNCASHYLAFDTKLDLADPFGIVLRIPSSKEERSAGRIVFNSILKTMITSLK